MKINFHYETDTLDCEHKVLDASCDGIGLCVCDEFMDDDQKEAGN